MTSEAIGPAEVFAIASQGEGFKEARGLLIGVEPQPTVCAEAGLRLSVDATLSAIFDNPRH